MPAASQRSLRIVVVTFGSVSEPRGGTAVRARAAVEAMRQLGHRVWVIGSDAPGSGARFARAAGVEAVVSLRRETFFGWSPELVRAVRRARRHCDLLVVENAMFLPAVAMARPRCPIVWDTNECQTLHYRRLAPSPGNRARLLAWRLLESLGARMSAVAVMIGADEERWWLRLYPQLRGRTLVVDHRPHLATDAAPRRPEGVPAAHRILLFVGNLVGKQNAASARWLLDNLAPRLPHDTTLVLAGPGTESLPATPGVRLLGAVDDIDALIRAADLCLAPVLSGAGVKTKVLHYLANGRPVLGTPLAFEGLGGAPGTTSVPIGGFAAAVGAALDAAAAGPEPSELASWVERQAGEAAVRRQWEAVLDRAAAGPGPRRPRGAG